MPSELGKRVEAHLAQEAFDPTLQFNLAKQFNVSKHTVFIWNGRWLPSAELFIECGSEHLNRGACCLDLQDAPACGAGPTPLIHKLNLCELIVSWLQCNCCVFPAVNYKICGGPECPRSLAAAEICNL